MKYAVMSRLMGRDHRYQRKLQLLSELVRSVSAATGIRPNRIMVLDEPDPKWPETAQRSFRAAQRLDAALKLKADKRLARLVQLHLKEDLREEDDLNRAQLALPMSWRITCGLKDEKPYTPPRSTGIISNGPTTWNVSGYERAYRAKQARLAAQPPVRRDDGTGKAEGGPT